MIRPVRFSALAFCFALASAVPAVSQSTTFSTGRAPEPQVLLCWSNPWELSDTTQWSEALAGIDAFKFYIDGIDPARVGDGRMRAFVSVLLERDIDIVVELGGLVDWHADKGSRSADFSFRDEYAKLFPLLAMIRDIDPSKSVDVLEFDGPIRRMLFPNDVRTADHTLSTAVQQLCAVADRWRDSIPDVRIHLLTNFPNWAWGDTPAYVAIDGHPDGYGRYDHVLDSVAAACARTGVRFDGLTIDNPFDYATGAAQSNQPARIAGVDWMARIASLDDKAAALGLPVHMIINTNGARDAYRYAEHTLALLDLYEARVGTPAGYWVQSWYPLPGAWLPESEPGTMTHLARSVLRRLAGRTSARAFLEPDDGRVYHGVQLMTFDAGDPIAGYLGMLADSTIQPAVRGYFFSIPGTRGPALSFMALKQFFDDADSIGFIPELSLFLVSDVATDSIIAVSSQYDWIIDSIAVLSKQYGRRMFLRIGGEFNGAGPGWNGGGYHPYHYVTMFRKICDRFAAHGMRDSVATIWCYEPDAPNDFDSVDARGARWYPGDEFVDWFGLDVFDAAHFDQSLPDYDRRGITRKGKSERFLAMARAKGRPVMMSETSAIRVNISSDEADGITDWNAWFAKFFEFIAVHPEIKGFSYINANWPDRAYPEWGDARIQNSPYVSGQYRAELRTPRYIHLPVRAAATPVLSPPAAARTLHLRVSPNPAPSSAIVHWEQAEGGVATITVHDLLGRPLAVLTDGYRSQGRHLVQFSTASLAPGPCLVTLQQGGIRTGILLLVTR